MSADFAVQCWDADGEFTPEYERIRGIAYVAIALYPVGVPLSYVALFWRTRDAIWTDTPTPLSKALDFLVGEFDSNYYFWELVEVTKKLLLVGAMSVVRPGEISQLIIAFVVAFCFLVVLLIAKPYKRPGDDVVALASGSALTMFFFFSIVLKFQMLVEAVQDVLSGQLLESYAIDAGTNAAMLVVSTLGALVLVGLMVVIETAAESVKGARKTDDASGASEADAAGGSESSPSDGAPPPSEADGSAATQARVAELEALVSQLQARLAHYENRGSSSSSGGGAADAADAEERERARRRTFIAERRRSLTSADSQRSLVGHKERPGREVSDRRSKQLANKAAKKRPSQEPPLSHVAEGAQEEGSAVKSPAASSHEQHVASSSSSMPPDAPADVIGDALSNSLSDVAGAHCSHQAFTCPGPSTLPVSKRRSKAAQADPATTSRPKSSLMVAQSKEKETFRV